MPTCIIIDDEEYSCELLQKKINKHLEDWHVLKLFTSPVEAINEIPTLQPDLIFLDIQMPEMSGFEFLSQLTHHKPAIIFVTAHDVFALKALKLNALDYLLKPVDVNDLKTACAKFRSETTHTETQLPSYQEVLHNLMRPSKIILNTAKHIEYVPIDNIIRCESTNAYTTFYLKEGKQIMVSINIGEYEEILQPYHFFRVHTSHLINLKQVVHFIKNDGGQVRMSDQSLIEVSRRRKEEFLQEIQKLSTGY